MIKKKKDPGTPRAHKVDFLLLPRHKRNFNWTDLHNLNSYMSYSTIVRRLQDLMLENLVVRVAHGLYGRHPSWT